MTEFLQERHNVVVGLVQRACRKGLVRKDQRGRNRCVGRVRRTRQETGALRNLASLRLEELKRIRLDPDKAQKAKPQFLKANEGAYVRI
jgi:hypothetical protein